MSLPSAPSDSAIPTRHYRATCCSWSATAKPAVHRRRARHAQPTLGRIDPTGSRRQHGARVPHRAACRPRDDPVLVRRPRRPRSTGSTGPSVRRRRDTPWAAAASGALLTPRRSHRIRYPARLAFVRTGARGVAPAPATWWKVALVGLGAAVIASLVARALPSVAARCRSRWAVTWCSGSVAGLASYAAARLLPARRAGRSGRGRRRVPVARPRRDVRDDGITQSWPRARRATDVDGVLVRRRPRAWLLLVETRALLAWFWADDRIVGRRWWLASSRERSQSWSCSSVLLLGAPRFLTAAGAAHGRRAGAPAGLQADRHAARSSLPWAAALVQAIPLMYLVTTTFPLGLLRPSPTVRP